MSEELKPCPFCGGQVVTIDDLEVWCGTCAVSVDIDQWNSRPIEDKLRDDKAVLLVTVKAVSDDRDKLREENDRFRIALQDIAEPIAKFQREADKTGDRVVDPHWAFYLTKDTNYLKQLAREALKILPLILSIFVFSSCVAVGPNVILRQPGGNAVAGRINVPIVLAPLFLPFYPFD